jgi:hypothetical protein
MNTRVVTLDPNAPSNYELIRRALAKQVRRHVDLDLKANEPLFFVFAGDDRARHDPRETDPSANARRDLLTSPKAPRRGNLERFRSAPRTCWYFRGSLNVR